MEGNLQDRCDFGLLKVTIEAVDKSTVTFSTRCCTVSKDPDECLLRSFTVPLAEVISTQIPGAPAPVPMTPGATGNLFLSRTGFRSTSLDGESIYGIDQVVFKWPECGASPSRVLSPLAVQPTSIVLRGHLRGQTEIFEIELLGPDAADTQDIVWNGAGFIELRLSSRGAARLRVEERTTVVEAWPTRIVVQGAPVVEPAVSGEVDILDLELAGEEQRLELSARGVPITLSLSQDGVNAFHVTPELVVERMRALEACPAPAPALAATPAAS